MRTGASGLIYDFFIYQGENSAGTEKCPTTDSVIRLVEDMPKGQNYELFFNNWFATIELLLQLKGMWIFTTATFRKHRAKDCPLPTEEAMKKNRSRGDFEYQTEQNTGLHLVRWLDNKCVTLGLPYVGVEGEIQKRKKMCRLKVLIFWYNESMRGVDLHDMLIASYMTKFTSTVHYTYVTLLLKR